MPSQSPSEPLAADTMPPFDEAWPELAEKLRRSLAARSVPAQDRDDVVQETALRVYRVWDTLDPTRSAWPFVITVAVNFWRDIVRERTGRIAQVQPTATIEVTDHHDVERDVMARQELASVRVAWRALAPEQRRLLLATEEFADTVRPLRPAERVARMRVRRQLARAVGRASAVLAVVWLRRPVRSTGIAAAAYASAMAATVFTAPGMTTMPLVTAAPQTPQLHASATHRVPAPATTVRPAARVNAARHTNEAASVSAPTGVTATPHGSFLPNAPTGSPERVCSPVELPASFVGVAVSLGATTIYGMDTAGNSQELAAFPGFVAKAANGCVGVSPGH